MRMMKRSLGIVAMALSLSGCGEGFREAQQQWLAYRYSPAYYERTYYRSVQTSAGSTYCKMVCGAIECRTVCESY